MRCPPCRCAARAFLVYTAHRLELRGLASGCMPPFFNIETMNLLNLSKEVKVGLMATVALTIVYLGLSFLKGKEIFSSTNVYYATYPHSRGLTTASPVMVNGIQVGKVSAIRVLPDQQYSASVTFEVSKDIQLTEATQAKLVSRNLLGNRAIELLIPAGSPIASHSTVTGRIEQGFSDAFAENAVPALNDMKDISLLANRLMTSFVENTEKVNTIFADLEATTQQVRKVMVENRQEIHTLIRHVRDIAGALADKQNGVQPLFTKMNQLVGGVQVAEIQQLLHQLDQVLSSMEEIAEKTSTGQNSLSRLLHDDSLYCNLNQILHSLDAVMVDLKMHPWRYLHFSIFGRRPAPVEVKAP